NFSLYPGMAELEEFERVRNEFVRKSGKAYQAFCRLAQVPCPWAEGAFANRSSAKKLKNLPKNYDEGTALRFFRQFQELSKAGSPADIWEKLLHLLLRQPPHPKKSEHILEPYIELLAALTPQNLAQGNEKFLAANGDLRAWPYYENIAVIEQFFQAFKNCFRPQARSLQSLFAAKFLLELRRKIAPKMLMNQLLHGIRGFSDMIEGLYRVLVRELYGDPQSLLHYLRLQYRCVLVDEFQDTDPIQWQILFRIFGHGSEPGRGAAGTEGPKELCRSHNYIVVGDPKQRIYRCRGASVFLYESVQQGCDFRFRLGTNYRSRPPVIGACNQIFATMWGPSFEAVSPGKTPAISEASYL
ncbi:MAG: UvrD-helicase domain-containing protein, partial [Spirochaetota bacterium]